MSGSPKLPSNLRDFSALVEIMKRLRAPDGCPWDREQSAKSLVPYAIEEAFELADAVEAGAQKDVVEELGDLLLQVVFHAEIAQNENRFDIGDVIEAINTKMIRRHPHVFSDTEVADSAEVLKNWDVLKAKEKENQPPTTSFSIPKNLPALQRAHKIGEKTRDFRFDWSSPEGVIDKLDEEIRELKEALKKNSLEHKVEELGDVLFTVAQLARHLSVEAEQSLRQANNRFERRFFTMRELAQKRRLDFDRATPTELENLWKEAKLRERYGDTDRA